MRIFLFVVWSVLTMNVGMAQGDSTRHANKRVRYFGSLSSGVLIGAEGRGTTVTAATIHGIRLNKIAIGLGIGYDDFNRTNIVNGGGDFYMRWKSVPLFLSFSTDWGKLKGNNLYIQLNGGYSIIRQSNPADMVIVENSEGGLMLNPSLGYRINSGTHKIYFEAGYKMQRNRYQYNTYPWIWGPPSGLVNVKETMQRVQVKIGFGWN